MNTQTTNPGPGILAGARSCTPVTPADAILNQTFKHHYWSDGIAKVVDSMLHQPDKSIIAFVGPTGVGKSCAISTIVNRVLKEKAEELRGDISRVAFGFVEVPKLTSRSTVWPSTLKLLVESLGEPLRKHKIRDFRNETEQARFDLEAVIEHRRPYAMFLDEFHHLVGDSRKEQNEDQIEYLKSICNRSHGKFVIVGTVRILKALHSNSETARRTEIVPFPRYRRTTEDLKSFSAVVREMQNVLGPHISVDLSADMEYVYERTIGCVGLLRNWLHGSLNVAIRTNDGVINYDILEERRLDLNTLRSIHNDAILCERYVEEKAEAWALFRTEIEEDSKGMVIPLVENRRKSR